MLLTSDESIICEFPTIRINFSETVDVELAHEAGEVGVLEVVGEQLEGELSDVPDDEGVAGAPPRDDGVGRLVLHHLVALAEERRQRGAPIAAAAARLHHCRRVAGRIGTAGGGGGRQEDRRRG